MLQNNEQKGKPNWRAALYEVVFESDTTPGRIFDLALLWSIVISVSVVLLDSIESIRVEYGELLYSVEWFFTILFSIEYVLRLISVKRPVKYALSVLGIIDLLAIVPTYFSLFYPGTQYLLVIRVLRLLRVFRILKLSHFLFEASVLRDAMKASRNKIIVFLSTVITIVVIIGSMMYVIEGPEYGFTNIPTSIYWAIVTMTTVGYGDISPHTPLGKFVASIIMITGYAIIAVPTGIVTVELSEASKKKEVTTQVCPACLSAGHDKDAVYCKYCGSALQH